MTDNEQYNIKYNLVLQLINKILVNIQKPEITDLIQFTDIQRETLLNESNLAIIESMESELFKYFDKTKCSYYRKAETKNNHIINCLRGLCKQIDYKMNSKEKGNVVVIDNEHYCKKYYVYFIEKK